LIEQNKSKAEEFKGSILADSDKRIISNSESTQVSINDVATQINLKLSKINWLRTGRD
jgi:hypothetical protein